MAAHTEGSIGASAACIHKATESNIASTSQPAGPSVPLLDPMTSHGTHGWVVAGAAGWGMVEAAMAAAAMADAEEVLRASNAPAVRCCTYAART